MSGFAFNGEVRSFVETLMTGVDNDIAEKLLDEVKPDWRGEPGLISRIRPQRSLFTAVARNAQPMLAEFEAVPGSADALQRIAVSLWQHAFRRELALSNMTIRDARTDMGESRIHYTITNGVKTGVFQRPIVGVPLPEFIEKRSIQLESVWLEVDGFRECAAATISALRTFALRYGFPINQVGMKRGVFRPTSNGGELRFSFYRSLPAPAAGVAKLLQPGNA